MHFESIRDFMARDARKHFTSSPSVERVKVARSIITLLQEGGSSLEIPLYNGDLAHMDNMTRAMCLANWLRCCFIDWWPEPDDMPAAPLSEMAVTQMFSHCEITVEDLMKLFAKARCIETKRLAHYGALRVAISRA